MTPPSLSPPPTGGARLLRAAMAPLAAIILAGTAQAQTAERPPGQGEVEIRRTAHGVPHIRALDREGLGFGAGYAYAQDNICLMADQIVTLSGERALTFGADGQTTVSFRPIPNIEADVFFRTIFDMDALRQAFAEVDPRYADMVRGYVAGYNRYLSDTGRAALPAPCRDADWVRPITLDDLLRLNDEKMVQASAGAWLSSIVAAKPPGGSPQTALRAPEPAQYAGLGSNGWAFGKAATAQGRGLVLANPHFPWATTNRFYQVHLTLPGELDVMGVTMAGLPGVSIGFNKDVAWTHTVSTDRHFSLFQLDLKPGDPLTYMVDGAPHPIEAVQVEVPVKGEAEPRRRTVYRTAYGPVVAAPSSGFAWDTAHAYALRDANRGNLRASEVWLRFGVASSVEDIHQALVESVGMPWVNTIAADRHGRALYADITATPNLSDAHMQTCAADAPAAANWRAARLFVLDGARGACDWPVSAETPDGGLMPGSAMPALFRDDFVANSNDSYWLTNPAAPLTGYPRVIGEEGVPQNLRTRSGLLEITAWREGSDGQPGRLFDRKGVETILYRNKVLAADLVLDDLLAACGQTPRQTLETGVLDLTQACAVLARWDRRADADSVGTHLFLEFWTTAHKIPDLYAIPFDPRQPVTTPHGLSPSPEVRAAALRALAEAVRLTQSRGLALDAPWGQVQVRPVGAERLAVHGADGDIGVLNAQRSVWSDEAKAYLPVHGSSYVQVVEFEADGPKAEAVLSYGQSAHPASPHYGDQTRLYAAEAWWPLPFTEAEIAADPALTVTRLTR
ncbi:MAG: acylase [Phenylobacterium sp.]|uniref:acylase n=1 Tax=Phenylobacterium sp. TaxID=1871053 RepID=UPI0027355DF5|nr:acylase [Phenylobacterium sp.]MDP1642134.1 acylase [Phenylobacterium sp.]MDP3116005.1 acylase [Phenylobacterium sp.]